MRTTRERFEYLKERLKERGITQKYIAREIFGGEKGHSYVSERMQGKRPWGIDDVYALMEAINEPPERIHIVFPPNGITKGHAEPPYISTTQALQAVCEGVLMMLNEQERRSVPIPSLRINKK